MPRIGLGDKSTLIVKMKNGYNVGISFERIIEIKKIKKMWKIERGKKSKISSIVFDEKLPMISIISTGGTISSRIDYRSGGVYAAFSAKDIANQIPDLRDIANIRAVDLMSKMSEDINYLDWIKIGRKVVREINSGSRGIIITHGTDTLHYTAAALSFMLKDLTIPVALVGSQRSSDRGSSDSVMNVSCAANFVTNSDVAEVVVIMHGTTNDDYCLAIRGTKVRKMHTSRRDAFRPINDFPIAKIHWSTRKIEFLKKEYRERSEGKTKLDEKFEPKVALIKVYPGMDPSIFDFYIKKRYKGFVIEGTGLGHVPTLGKFSLLPKIERLKNMEIPVVMTSQCIYGKTHPTIYHNLRELYKRGVVFVEDMLPEVAYVKLMWVLGHTKDYDKVKEMMKKNFAGEISDHIDLDTFLF